MKNIIVIVIIVFLFGCVGAPVKITDEQVTRINDIGAVTLLSKNPKIHYVGFTMFNNNYTTAVLDGWDPNSMIDEYLSNKLQANGYMVHKISQYTDLMKVYENDWGKPNKERIEDDLYNIGKNNKVDTLIVII